MQAADTVGIVPCLEGGGKLRNEFSVEMIHAATVHIVCLGILADGFALNISFPEICAVAFENGFEAVIQKSQVLFEDIEFILAPYADIPFLRDTQIVSAQIDLVIGAEVFGVGGVGFGAAKPSALVCEFFLVLRFLLSDGAFKAAVVQVLDMSICDLDLRLTDELIYPFAVHFNHLAEGLLGHGVILTAAGIDPFMEDNHLTAGIYVGNDSDNIYVFVIVPLVEAGKYSSVVLLSHRRSFPAFILIYYSIYL